MVLYRRLSLCSPASLETYQREHPELALLRPVGLTARPGRPRAEEIILASDRSATQRYSFLRPIHSNLSGLSRVAPMKWSALPTLASTRVGTRGQITPMIRFLAEFSAARVTTGFLGRKCLTYESWCVQTRLPAKQVPWLRRRIQDKTKSFRAIGIESSPRPDAPGR